MWRKSLKLVIFSGKVSPFDLALRTLPLQNNLIQPMLPSSMMYKLLITANDLANWLSEY